MPKITNAGKTPRAFHLASKGDYVELSQGDSVEVSADDLAALGKSASFAASVVPNALVIEGAEWPPADAAPAAPAKGKKAAAASTDGAA